MKTRVWIIILAVAFLLCAGLSLWLLLPGEEAAFVQVRSEGVLLYTLPLNVDTEVVVESSYGTNVVTVRDGKVAVTRADCPDGYCMDRGWCSTGVQIVCLPNRLVLEFAGAQKVDGIAG